MEDVTELRSLDLMRSSLVSQIVNVVETHAKDEFDMVTSTPVFMGLIKATADSYKEFKVQEKLLEKRIPAKKGKSLTRWNLDYEAGLVSCEYGNTVSVAEMITVEVPADVSERVYVAHMQHSVVEDVITKIMEEHARDQKDTVTKSAIFKALLSLKAELYKDYLDQGEKMWKTYVPDTDKTDYKQCSWALNYNDNMLTLYK